MSSATRVVLVDSGGANIASVQAAFTRLGIAAPITADAEEIRRASHVVLPGVGAAAPAMARLRAHGLIDCLRGLSQPVLGVCIGVQLLFDHSEEADVACLGLIPGQVRRLPAVPGLRIPHMGWNRVHVRTAHPLCQGLDQQYAYFVHSFAADLGPHTLAQTQHGSYFSAVVARDNFMGAQFHPERSQETGQRLLKNFLEMR